MHAKSALCKTSAKPQALLIRDSIRIPQMTTKTITAFVDHLSEWNTTRDRDSSGKIHRSREFDNILFNVNNK